MGIRKTIAPGAKPLATEALRQQARLAETEWDQKLDAVAMAALEWAEAVTGRAILTSTVTLTLTHFPYRIRLPYPPLVTVDAFSYKNDAGDTVAMVAGTDYEVSSNTEPPVLSPLYGEAWPTPLAHLEPITIVYTAGYGDEPDEIPDSIREAMLIKAEAMFGGGDPQAVALLNETALAVIRPYRLGALLVFPDDPGGLQL